MVISVVELLTMQICPESRGITHVVINIPLFEHGKELISSVEKFSQGCTPRQIFPEGSVIHNHDQNIQLANNSLLLATFVCVM